MVYLSSYLTGVCFYVIASNYGERKLNVKPVAGWSRRILYNNVAHRGLRTLPLQLSAYGVM